jgi:hypothetical protein
MGFGGSFKELKIKNKSAHGNKKWRGIKIAIANSQTTIRIIQKSKISI